MKVLATIYLFLTVFLIDLASGHNSIDSSSNELASKLTTNGDDSEISVNNLKAMLDDLHAKRETVSTSKEQAKRDTIAEVAEFVPSEDGTKEAPSIEITYRIEKSSQRTPRDVIESTLRKAFDKWEEKADVAFVPKQDGVADLEIRFEEGSHDSDGHQAFDGKGGIAAHAFKNKNGGGSNDPIGGIHFDDGDDWTEESLLRVSTFEIGKLLQKLQEKDTEIEEITTTDTAPSSSDPSIGLQGPNPLSPYYPGRFPYGGGLYNADYGPYPGGDSFGWGPGSGLSGPSFEIYNNYYQPGPYYGGPGYQVGPYGYGPGYGRSFIEVDTFYWSNYGATSGLGLNSHDVGQVQRIFGAPNRDWLRNRHLYRERFGNQYSAGGGTGLRHYLYGNKHLSSSNLANGLRHNLAPARYHIGISNRHMNLHGAPGLGLRSGLHGSGFGHAPGFGFGHELRAGAQGFSGGHGAMPGFGGRHGGFHRGGGHRG